MATKKQPLEKEIQLVICQYLTFKKYFFWRQNTAPVWEKDRYRAMPKYSLNGVPDILLLKDGLFVGLEVKRPKGVQSEAQKEFEILMKANGGAYKIVTSLDDVIDYGL